MLFISQVHFLHWVNLSYLKQIMFAVLKFIFSRLSLVLIPQWVINHTKCIIKTLIIEVETEIVMQSIPFNYISYFSLSDQALCRKGKTLKLELFDVLVLEQFYVLCFKSYIIKMLEFFSPLIFVAWLFCLPSFSLGPSLTWCPKTELLVLSPLPTSGLWLRQPPRHYAVFASRNLFIFSVWSVFWHEWKTLEADRTRFKSHI